MLSNDRPTWRYTLLSDNMRIAFITSNEAKFAEARDVCNANGIDLYHISFEYDEPRADDCITVVRKSVEILKNRHNFPFIIEDSGLFINALNGFPGPYSAWAYKKIGLDGILRLMEGVGDRSCYFVSAVGFYDGENTHVFDGRVDGTLSTEVRGSEGFGYDPLFIPKDYKFTFSENMSLKRKLSHRTMAIKKFVEHVLKVV